MRAVIFVGAVLVTTGCGDGSQGEPAAVEGTVSLTADPTPLPPEPPLPPRPSGCPATYADATPHDGEVCSDALPSGCAYAEGTCECVGWWSGCHGAAPSPPPRVPGHEDDPPSAEERGTWRCTPRPPARRDDGCPRDRPPDGFACTGNPESCGYGAPSSCCGVELRCVGGTWVSGREQCMP